MKFLHSDWILICDDNFTIIKDGGVVFDEQIVDVGEIFELKKNYPNENFEYQGENSVIMPGLINPHVHLEFSSNKTTLKYGDFNEWLNSVIAKRETISEKSNKKLIDETLNKLLKTGTTTIGAISSYGAELESCVQTPINVVYFNEAIGSKADMIDTLFSDFKARLNNSKAHASKNFIPAIAIHSPYSIHPFLTREVLSIAKDEKLSVSAHFLESKAERDWLLHSEGGFKAFFESFLKMSTSLISPKEFLQSFRDIKNLSFTHCVEVDDEELNMIKDLDASIIHCPKSNRLLNNKTLDIKRLDDINFSLGTDGLSSNDSLNMFDELRGAFYMHTTIQTNILADKLLSACTLGAAKTLGLDKGSLQKDKDADIISFILPDEIEDISQLSTHIILHTNQVQEKYIGGKQC